MTVKSTQIFTEKKIVLVAIVVNTVCQMKNGNNKYYPQIFMEKCEYQEKNEKKKHIKEKIVIPDSDESYESDKSDESID